MEQMLGFDLLVSFISIFFGVAVDSFLAKPILGKSGAFYKSGAQGAISAFNAFLSLGVDAIVISVVSFLLYPFVHDIIYNQQLVSGGIVIAFILFVIIYSVWRKEVKS